MCCGNDSLIRFVCIDGYHQSRSMSVTPNLKEWKQEAVFCIGDLWSDTAYLKLPPPTAHTDLAYPEHYPRRCCLLILGRHHVYVHICSKHKTIYGRYQRAVQTGLSTLPRIFQSNFSSYLNKVNSHVLPFFTRQHDVIRVMCELLIIMVLHFFHFFGLVYVLYYLMFVSVNKLLWSCFL